MSANDLTLSNAEHGLCGSESRHSSDHAPGLSSIRHSPLHTQEHRGRDALRQSFHQSHMQPRRPSSPAIRSKSISRPSIRSQGYPGGAVGVSSSLHDSLPQRLSLDSQRTAISSSSGGGSVAESRPNSMGSSLRNSAAESCMEHIVGDSAAAPMWSDEQLRRARRFSSSHIRGVSCPTLNITRIMRSISMSNIHSLGRAPYRPSRNEPLSPTPKTRFHSQRQQPATALVSPDPAHSDAGPAPALPTSRNGHRKPSSAVVRTLNQDAATAKESNGDDAHENSCSNGSDIEGSSKDNDDQLSCLANEDPHISYSSTTATDFSVLNNANMPSTLVEQSQSRRTSSDGLRRRIPARYRDIGTPDISILEEEDENIEEEQSEDAPLPLSPALLDNATSVMGESSTSSSARWSTISAEPPHKRYSYSSAAIAEALRNLESVERYADLDALSTSSHHTLSILPSSDRPANETSGETMTITLKAPYKRESTDTPQQNGAGRRIGNAQHHSEPKESYDSSLTEGSEKVAIPAVYLDSTASLWDQYVAELQSSDFDPNIHLKRQRMSQFLRIPWNVEKLLWFGVAICIDALLYVFSILPAKFACAAVKLGISVAYDMPVLLESAFSSSLVQTTLRSMPISWSRRLTRLGLNSHRWLLRISGRSTEVPKADNDSNNNSNTAASGHVGRWLSPMQLFDFYRGLLFIVTCVLLCRIDAAQLYHGIRAQGSLKLYFIFSTLDIFDRLLSSFGHDALDALQSTVTDPWSQRWKTGPAYFVLAQAYMLVHTLVLFYQMITLHVAVNSYSDQLLALLISNRFVEIKSNVFKKWEKEMLFQISCADIVERFQETIFLFLIILRNLAELSGSGSSSIFDTTSSPSTTASTASGATANVLPPAQLPVSFDKATPSAFGPLIPSWMSMPVVNRIITPILMVLGSEILIDWIKHSFITKLNWIRPEVYSHYIGILSRDLASPKTGSGVCIKPPPELDNAGLRVSSISGSDADEKITRSSSDLHTSSSIDTERKTASSAPRTRSSSILMHTALRVLEWVRGDDEAEEQQRDGDSHSRENNSCSRRRRGHQSAHSVTKPQMFVEQSTRVSRRLGLSPMPLACLIILVLVQMVHILVWPPRTHHHINPSALAGDNGDVVQATSGISVWVAEQIAGVPVIGTVGGMAARACGWTIERVVLKGMSAAAYAALHPQKAMVSALSVVFLDAVGWMAIGVVAYAVVVWIKLGFGSRLMDFAWSRYQEFERQTNGTSSLRKFDDDTRKLDRDAFAEVGKLINKDASEAEWEKQRPKWTLDNIERFSLFKSRIQ